MTVDIKGVYLKALELMVNDYNEDTVKRWDKGEDVWLRKKEKPETFINFIVLSFFREHHPEMYESLIEELQSKAGLNKKNGDAFKGETDAAKATSEDALTAAIEFLRKDAQFSSSKYYKQSRDTKKS